MQWKISTSAYSFQMQRTPELRFFATVGEEPEVEVALALTVTGARAAHLAGRKTGVET